jgi:hypothetical protein
MRISNLASGKMLKSGGNGKGLERDGYSLFEGTFRLFLGVYGKPKNKKKIKK